MYKLLFLIPFVLSKRNPYRFSNRYELDNALNECFYKDKTFKNKEELESIFQSCLENINEKNIVFSCGSGVTACVLALAYSLINDKYHPCIYDGSWAEYGII